MEPDVRNTSILVEDWSRDGWGLRILFGLREAIRRARSGSYPLLRHMIFSDWRKASPGRVGVKATSLDGERFVTFAEFEATWVRCDLNGASIFNPKGLCSDFVVISMFARPQMQLTSRVQS